MTNHALASLSDSELLVATARAADVERRSIAELIALLAEVDLRKLYLGRGYSSLFVYCTQALRLSESATYARITAARASRSFPSILPRLTDGSVTLTTVTLLSAHLTDDNQDALLEAASNKSRREVERLVASLVSQPDVASSIRRLPDRNHSADSPEPSSQPKLLAPVPMARSTTSAIPVAPVTPPPAALLRARPVSRPVIAPLGAERYFLRVTLSGQAPQTLERARALLRHQIPSGDPAAIVERALAVLLDQLERTKHARTSKSRAITGAGPSTSRHVPAVVKREVWARDSGRCAFVGTEGRCSEVGFLEYHHVLPFAAGGATDSGNLELRCRAHNAYEATLAEQRAMTGSPAGPMEPGGPTGVRLQYTHHGRPR